MKARFGPAGNSQSFYEQGYKSSLDMPRWLNSMGLEAYEYQCTRGVNMKEETARKIGKVAAEYDITLSIHGPYYINLAAGEKEKREKTKGHLLKSMRAACWMGAGKVVFHPGSVSGMKREEALARAGEVLGEVLSQAREEGLEDIKLAPETMGKHSQLGNLDEIVELCTVSPAVVPAVDFAHLHALWGGGLNEKEDFARVLDKIEKHLSRQAVNELHIHFSPVEYTQAGEKKHRTLLDEGFGPPFQPLAELIAERNLGPTLICESNGRQAEDALVYKDILQKAVK